MLFTGPNEAASAFGPDKTTPKPLAKMANASKLEFDMTILEKSKNRRNAERKHRTRSSFSAKQNSM
jgi:hypothetical protein